MNEMIDWNDPRIKPIICSGCGKITPVERDSQLDKESLCDRCSHRVDAILNKAIIQGRA